MLGNLAPLHGKILQGDFLWVPLDLMSFIYFEKVSNFDSFDVSIVIKTPFLRVSVTIEPYCFFFTARYPEMFDRK